MPIETKLIEFQRAIEILSNIAVDQNALNKIMAEQIDLIERYIKKHVGWCNVCEEGKHKDAD